MAKKIEANQRFGKWTVIERAPNAKDAASSQRWLCQCECGRRRIVYAQYLRNGKSTSCGCGKSDDLMGQRFGRLTVQGFISVDDRRANWKSRSAAWRCQCDCGNVIDAQALSLKRGSVKSCGCLIHRSSIKQNGGRLYGIYSGMKSRCYNPNATGYKNYGGRGITVCDEWLSDFWAFHAWAMANGYAEDLTIDRIDNDKGYSPDNCRWATRADQNRNKRTVKIGGAINA